MSHINYTVLNATVPNGDITWENPTNFCNKNYYQINNINYTNQNVNITNTKQINFSNNNETKMASWLAFLVSCSRPAQ